NNNDSINENLSVNNLSVNNLSVNRSSINRSKRKCSKIFNFLLGGRRSNNSNKTEWENLCIQQKVTKSANADNTVRQASSANDNISAYAHATERNRNSLSGSQTQ
ncbi:hypothetical protein PIROE2DRAFT_66795, partial [Piromyces sp. E2]